jgi:hypothetical protein
MTRGFGAIAPALGVLCLVALILLQDGATWRLPEDRQYPDSTALREAESDYCDDAPAAGTDPLGELVTCRREISAEAPTIYVWGDSHARHLIAGLAEVYGTHNIRILYLSSCMAQSGFADYRYDYEGRSAMAADCVARNLDAMARFEALPPTLIILQQYYGYEATLSDQWLAATDVVLDRLRASGHRLALFGAPPEPGPGFADCFPVPALIPDDVLDERCSLDRAAAGRVAEVNRLLSERFGAVFVDASGPFCGADGVCRGREGDVLLFRDTHHLTTEGARRLIAANAERLDALFAGVGD